jgi:inhibitor of lysozyme (Ivy)
VLRYVLTTLLILGICQAAAQTAPQPPSKPTDLNDTPLPTNEDYIFTIIKKRPAILKRWSGIVPPRYADDRWIKYLDGTTGPVDRVIVTGKRFVLGYVCWPHNCGGNSVAFLLAADGSDAYGMLRSADLNATDEIFGSPDENKRKMLAAYLSRIW